MEDHESVLTKTKTCKADYSESEVYNYIDASDQIRTHQSRSSPRGNYQQVSRMPVMILTYRSHPTTHPESSSVRHHHGRRSLCREAVSLREHQSAAKAWLNERLLSLLLLLLRILLGTFLDLFFKNGKLQRPELGDITYTNGTNPTLSISDLVR